MDDDLRNGLWNVFFKRVLRGKRYGWLSDKYAPRGEVERLWESFLKEPLDSLPSKWDQLLPYFKSIFTNGEWWRVYNALEFTAQSVFERYEKAKKDQYISEVNAVLAREMAGYRFVGDRLAPITSPEEISAVAEAIHLPLTGVQKHLSVALEKFSAKPEPDYPNTIKEAISAVESLARVISGKRKATLGDALKVIDARAEIHPALKKAFLILYGYTSDEGGIRHALVEDSKVTFDEAKIMLVSCSAFVNYMVGRAAAGGLDLSSKPDT